MTTNTTNKALTHSWRAVLEDDTITMNLKECPLPGLTVNPIELGATSDHNNLKIHGNKIEYDELTMEFFISEDWENYMQIYRWIMRYLETDDIATKEFTLQMLDNTGNVIKNFVIEDCFPHTMSTVETTVIDNDSYLLCTVTFAYERWYPQGI